MRVKEAMHTGATWCTPDTPLVDVARIMRDEDIGCLPIGENDRLVGMVTDRDLAVRAVAEGNGMLSVGDVSEVGTQEQKAELVEAVTAHHA